MTTEIDFLDRKIKLKKLPQDDDLLSDIIEQLPYETRAIEVGAHVGKFSKQILERFNDALIIEGEEVNYENLLLRFPQHKNKIMKCVVYNDDKEHNWFFATGSGTNALIMPLLDSQKRRMKKTKVNTVTLDTIDFNFDFIKIDCEGADFNILRGAEKLIDKNKPLIYFEHSGENGALNHKYTKDIFFDFFKRKNYSLFLANGDKFLPSMWYIDTKKETNSYNILAIPNR